MEGKAWKYVAGERTASQGRRVKFLSIGVVLCGLIVFVK